MRDSHPASSPVGQAHWRLQLCGEPHLVNTQGRRIALERRDAAMLALIVVEGRVARNRLVALLWPGEPVEPVRSRLRQRLFALKGRLGVEVVSGKGTLCATPALHWAGLDAEPADGDLLGDDYADLPEFCDWLAGLRVQVQGLRRERLAAEASSLEQQGRLAEAIVCAERLLALEPLQEHAHRRLMRLHYLRGDRAAALLAFDACERELKDEVGARPSQETLELLAQIERSQPLSGSTMRRVVPASVLRPPRVIGRDADWGLMQSAWTRGVAIVLVGEAGMGKTRLLSDLVSMRASASGRILHASARPGDERVPYALFGRLLRAALADRVEPLTSGVREELARVLPELSARERPAAAADGAAQARLVGAIESTFRDAVSSGLQAVALDDLHFADAASLEMVQHLAGLPGLRWLVAYRGAEIGAAARALVDTLVTRLHGEPVVLQPLTQDQLCELLSSLGIAALDERGLAEGLHRRTGGNPLFVLETLKLLLLQQAPAGDGRAQPLADVRLPTSSSAVRLIEQRIGQLSREAVRLARCAAVAGQDFSAGLAAGALEVNPLDLADAWAELESAQVLRDGAFAHDLILEAARASVPAPIARALHRRIAELLTAEGAAPARLAAHWLGAGDERRAAPHLAAAGRLAFRAMRVHEGLDDLDQAQSIYGRAGEVDAQCALIDELIAPAVVASSFDRIRLLVEQAAQRATDDRQRSMALRSLGSLLAYRSEYEAAHEAGQQALAAALRVRDRACEFRARSLLASLLGEMGRGQESVAMLRPIERWVHSHGSVDQRLEHADALAKVLQDSGQLEPALDQRRRAIDIARSSDAAHALPVLLANRAATLMLLGRLEEGRGGMLEAQELLHELPDDAMIRRVFALRLQAVERSLGHYGSSLAYGERILADSAAGPAEVDEARLTCAFAYCDLGQVVRAQQLLRQAQASAYAFNGFVWKELGAQMPLPEDQHDGARREALEAAAEAARQWSGRNLLSVWRIQATHAEDEVAVAAARKGMEFASAAGMRGQQLTAQALLARRLANLGDAAQAVWLAKDCWRLMADFCPIRGYRGTTWRALIEVLEPHDAALAATIAQHAADWIFRTAAEHVPPAFRESFLHRNPCNEFLLAQVRDHQAAQR